MDYKLDGCAADTINFEKETFGELQAKETVQQPESEDDDCMIVEDEEPSGSFSALDPLPQPNITVKPLSELQLKLKQSISSRQLTNFTIENNANSNRLQITNLGTTPINDISTATCDLLASAQLPQTQISMNGPLNSQLVQLSNTSQGQIPPLTDKQSAAILCGLPPNAVITGVAPAPQEAPYATTIYISNISSTVPTVSNEAQGHDKQVAKTLESNPQTSSKTNSQPVTTTLENTSNVRFLTPDVRVTATGDSTSSELLSMSALKTMSNSNLSFCSLPVSQQQNSILDKRGSVGSSIMASSAEITTKVTSATERQHSPADVKSSANISPGDWKRFLMDDNSKHSTIGSTTITKMADKLESDGKMVMNIEGDEFEPDASVLIKPNATALSTEAHKTPFVTGVESNTNKCTINGTSAITICPASIAMKTKTSTQSSTTAATNPITSSTNTDIMALPFGTLPSQKELKKSQPVTTTTVLSKSSTSTHSSTTRTKSTTLNSTVAISKAPSTSISNAMTLSQSFMQVKIPSRSMRPPKTQSFRSRQSLPSSSRSLINSAVTNGGSVISPKPLINIRSAVPLPQRANSTKTTTQRLSDTALLSPNILNRRLSGAITTKRSIPTTILHKKSSEKNSSVTSRPATSVPSKPSETVNNNTQIGNTKPSEQYGVLCSSSNEGSPRFWAKRMLNSYLIKVPGLSSVVHRTDLESVDTYLNQ